MILLEVMLYGILCISFDCMFGLCDMIKFGLNGEFYILGVIDDFVGYFNCVIFGEVKYQYDIIFGMIERFYDVLYFKNFNNVIFLKL